MDALISLLLWPWRLFSSLVSNCLRLCVAVVLFPVRCVASLAKLCLDILIAIFSWAESKIALLKTRKPFVYLFPSLPGDSKDLVLLVPIPPTSIGNETRQMHRRRRKKKAQLSGNEESSAEARAREAERNLSLILELIRLSKDKALGETDNPQPPLTADESIYWLSQQLRQKSEGSGHAATTSKEEEAKLVGIVKDLQQYAAHERAKSPSHVHSEEGSDVSSMLHDLGQLESYLSRFVEDAEEDSACTPHARATSLETIPEEYNSKESSPRLPRSRHLSSTSATDQDDGMGEVMEEFARTFEDLKSSKQGSKETASTSKGGSKCQSLGEVNQPCVSSVTRRSDSRQKKQKAPQKQSGKEQTSQRQMRERVVQQGLHLRHDSSSSQRSSLDSPDFDSSPVTPAQENKQAEHVLINTQEELQSVFDSLMQQPATSSDKPSPAKGTTARPASPATEPYQEQIYDTLPCPPNPPKPSSSLTAEQKRALREFAGIHEDIYDTLPSQLASNPKTSSTASPSATPPQLPPPLRRTGSDGGASTGSEGSPYAKRKRDFRRHSAEDGEYERRRHRHRRHSHRHSHGSSDCCHYRDYSPDRCDCCHRSRPREHHSCCHGCQGCSGSNELHGNCDHQTRGLVRDSSGYESQEEERRKRTDSVGSGGRATPTNPSTPKDARKGLFGLFSKKSNSLTSLSSRGGDQSDQLSVSSYKL